jgi:tetratricopeptide (TPR) repeat protein
MQDSALNQSQQQAMDYLTKGLSFENQDEYKNAIDTYKQGLKTFPEEKNFHNRLARIYLNHNEKEKAAKHFSQYMKNNTDIEPESVLIYGNLLLDLHGTEKALEFYKELDTTKLNCPEINNLIHQLENNKIPPDDIEPGPGNTKFSTDTIANLFTFFSGRENNYAIQWVKDNKTGYAPANEPLGFQTAARHLNGEITLGIYQLNVASQVKWCVFDVDIKKILVDQREDEGKNVNFLLYQALTAAKELQSVITSRELKSYVEFSGNKGYHVWIFFESFISTDLKEYKHPVLHIKEYELEQEELSQQRTEALKFQKHLEKFIEAKKELKEKVDFVKSLEKYLNKYLDQKNIEELKTEFGVLRRIIHPNGDTSLVMEL